METIFGMALVERPWTKDCKAFVNRPQNCTIEQQT